MPYIKQAQREEILAGREPQNVGELTYLLCIITDNYIKDRAREDGKRSYQRFAEAVGALDNARSEYYRRVISKYEDEKHAENGDVFHAVPWDN